MEASIVFIMEKKRKPLYYPLLHKLRPIRVMGPLTARMCNTSRDPMERFASEKASNPYRYYRGVNKYQYHFEVHLRYRRPELCKEYRTIMLVII